MGIRLFKARASQSQYIAPSRSYVHRVHNSRRSGIRACACQEQIYRLQAALIKFCITSARCPLPQELALGGGCNKQQAVSLSPASVETPDYMTMRGIGNRYLVRKRPPKKTVHKPDTALSASAHKPL